MNLNHHSKLIRGLTKHWLQSSWAKEWSRWRQYWIEAVVLLREMTLNAPFQAVSCRYHRTNNFHLCHSSSAGASKAQPGPTQTRLRSPQNLLENWYIFSLNSPFSLHIHVYNAYYAYTTWHLGYVGIPVRLAGRDIYILNFLSHPEAIKWNLKWL